MAGQLPVLSACMFGRFRMTYGDSPLSFGRSMTKVQKLLLILLYSGEEGIARNKLLEDLELLTNLLPKRFAYTKIYV